MAAGADVRSIPALRDWLAAVATYREEAAEAVSGINQEIRRGFAWIEEQMTLWQRAVRDCEEEVTQAKAELAARRFPGFDGRMPDTTVQERNLRRAQARLEYAELCHPVTLERVDDVDGPALLALAVWLGEVRLIDNTGLVPPAAGSRH